MRTSIAVALLMLLTSCGGGESNTAPPPVILGMLFSFPSGAAPTGLPNALVYVGDGITGNAVTNASVTVNGFALSYNSSPSHLEYEGNFTINPGDAITLSVTVNGKTYTSNATQPTSYPALSAPSSGAVWGTLGTNSVSWTGVPPLADTYYLLGVLDANDPAGGTPYFHPLAPSATTYDIPPYSLSAGNKDLIIGITSVSRVANADASSGIIVGGFSYVPITVNSGTANIPPTLTGISVNPADSSVLIGGKLQLGATGHYSDNSTLDLTPQVTWTTSDPTVATVDATGMVFGISNGTATISATQGNVTASTSLTALPIVPVQIVSTTPPSASPAASVYSTISVKFNQSVVYSATTLQGFTLTQNGIPVDGSLLLNNAYDTISLTPTTPLLPNTQYVASLNNTFGDSLGFSYPISYSWSFTTESTLFREYVSTQTPAYPEAIAIGDVNGDSRNDVVITTSASRSLGFDPANEYKVFVYLQDATGNLLPPVKYATSAIGFCRVTAVDIGDLNNDGRQDVVAGNSACGLDVFLQAADGSLGTAIHYASTDANKIRIADINKDGRLDVVGAGNRGDNYVSIWLQNASGTLDAPTRYSVILSAEIDLEVGDINNDGLTDVVVMSSAWADPDMEVLTQNADGTFNLHTDYSIRNPTNTSSLAVGDINGDNLPDAIVGYESSPAACIGIFSQNTQGTFSPEICRPVFSNAINSVTIYDVTGDGRKDVITLHHGNSEMGVLEQLADGTLKDEHLYRRPANTSFNPQSLAVGDINGDGQPDAVSIDTIYGLVINYHY